MSDLSKASPQAVHALHQQARETVELAAGLIPGLMNMAAMQRAHDEVVAYLHGGPIPVLTPGAQAILNTHRSEQT